MDVFDGQVLHCSTGDKMAVLVMNASPMALLGSSLPAKVVDERHTRLTAKIVANRSILRESRTEASLLRPPQARHKDRPPAHALARAAEGRRGIRPPTRALDERADARTDAPAYAWAIARTDASASA